MILACQELQQKGTQRRHSLSYKAKEPVHKNTNIKEILSGKNGNKMKVYTFHSARQLFPLVPVGSKSSLLSLNSAQNVESGPGLKFRECMSSIVKESPFLQD